MAALLLVVSLVGAPVNAAAGTFAPLPPTKPEQQPNASYQRFVQSGFEHYYSLEYDKSVAAFERALELQPQDPTAVNHLLGAVLFRELYRSGALNTNLYASNSFLDRKKPIVDKHAREQILKLTELALALSEERLKHEPNNVSALYARGVTRGFHATYTGLLEQSWMAALKAAKAARSDHERVLELAPQYTDAKTILGVHEYIAGSLPFFFKVGAALMGYSGSKTKGLRYLYEAAQGGGESSIDARIALGMFLRREERFLDALEVVQYVTREYPRNFLFALEEANILKDAGKGPESIAAYQKVLTAGERGVYSDPHLEFAAFGLGEALKGQRQFKPAAEAYEKALTYSTATNEMKQKALLAAGEMRDLLSERKLAEQHYKAAIKLDDKTEAAAAARKHLKKPYKYQD